MLFKDCANPQSIKTLLEGTRCLGSADAGQSVDEWGQAESRTSIENPRKTNPLARLIQRREQQVYLRNNSWGGSSLNARIVYEALRPPPVQASHCVTQL